MAATTSEVIDTVRPAGEARDVSSTIDSKETIMTNDDARAYVIGYLTDVRMGPAIVEYLERIDATLEPYGGRFIIHGGTSTVLEGSMSGSVIVLEFPDGASAQNWYDSPEYQDILTLRTDNATSRAIIIDGVGTDHVATDVLRTA